MKYLAGVLGGLILAILGAILVAVAGTSSAGSGGSPGAVALVICWVAGVGIALYAPSAAKAWRRVLITAAVMSLMLPLAGLVFTGQRVAETAQVGGEFAGAATAGAAIGGGLVTGFMGFVGFFLGAVLLVMGLLIGRDKPAA